MMHPNELVASLRTLVDDYERLIDRAKLLRALQSKEEIDEFISSADRVLEQSRLLLPEAKSIVNAGITGDIVSKHISAYYRMIKLVSIRYVIDLLEEALPSFAGNLDAYGGLQRLIYGFRDLQDTL